MTGRKPRFAGKKNERRCLRKKKKSERKSERKGVMNRRERTGGATR